MANEQLGPDPAPPLWTVEDQRHTTEITAAGTVRDVMEVIIRTVSGVTFPLRIPLGAYSPEAVMAAADAYAQQIETVQNIQGPTPGA